MARATKKVCSVPGCPAIQAETRCSKHRAERDRFQRRTTPTKVTRDYTEQQRRASAVRAHVDRHGYWCPGWGERPAHWSKDLTADHVVEIDAGGDPRGPLHVLCRSCNSAKNASRKHL